MHMHSPHWDEEAGSCKLHGVPSYPCPACLAEKNKDIEFVLNEIDRMMIEDGEATLEEILPPGFGPVNGNAVR